MTLESFLCIVLVNMMQSMENAHMRDNIVTALTAATADKPYSCKDILKCWEYEQQLIDGNGNAKQSAHCHKQRKGAE
jgi:hypothetical protein